MKQRKTEVSGVGSEEKGCFFAHLSSCINGLLSMTKSLQIDLYIHALDGLEYDTNIDTIYQGVS